MFVHPSLVRQIPDLQLEEDVLWKKRARDSHPPSFIGNSHRGQHVQGPREQHIKVALECHSKTFIQTACTFPNSHSQEYGTCKAYAYILRIRFKPKVRSYLLLTCVTYTRHDPNSPHPFVFIPYCPGSPDDQDISY